MTCKDVWLCLAMFGCVWLWLAMVGDAYLYLAAYEYLISQREADGDPLRCVRLCLHDIGAAEGPVLGKEIVRRSCRGRLCDKYETRNRQV